jgi:hypothetical protein
LERHLRDSQPRFALVVWPDIAAYAELPCCIPLAEVALALDAGAVLVALEDADFCKPRNRVMPDPIILRIRFNHPYRLDATWRPPKREIPDDNGCNDPEDD